LLLLARSIELIPEWILSQLYDPVEAFNEGICPKNIVCRIKAHLIQNKLWKDRNAPLHIENVRQVAREILSSNMYHRGEYLWWAGEEDQYVYDDNSPDEKSEVSDSSEDDSESETRYTPPKKLSEILPEKPSAPEMKENEKKTDVIGDLTLCLEQLTMSFTELQKKHEWSNKPYVQTSFVTRPENPENQTKDQASPQVCAGCAAEATFTKLEC
jgi:hypothetical protein